MKKYKFTMTKGEAIEGFLLTMILFLSTTGVGICGLMTDNLSKEGLLVGWFYTIMGTILTIVVIVAEISFHIEERTEE